MQNNLNAFTLWEEEGVDISKHLGGVDSTEHLFEMAATEVGGLQGKNVLLAGGGSGFAAEQAAKFGASVYSLDINPTFVQSARTRFRRKQIKEAYPVQGDCEVLPFRSNSVAATILEESLTHFSDPATALKEIYRITERNGVVAASNMYIDPNASKFILDMFGPDSIFYRNAKYIANTDAVEYMLLQSGFRNVSSRILHFNLLKQIDGYGKADGYPAHIMAGINAIKTPTTRKALLELIAKMPAAIEPLRIGLTIGHKQ